MALPKPWLLLVLLLLAAPPAFSDHNDESAALLAFKSGLNDPAAQLADWGKSESNPCDKPAWSGIICTGQGSVLGLQLENMSLSGRLDLGPLASLPDLRTISFYNNSFEGPMPDLSKVKVLRSIYLSMNNFSGPVPDDAFAGMGSLKRVHLYSNNFTGPIPSSLAGASKLIDLMVNDNEFQGAIPDLRQQLQVFNVSDNRLVGRIPDGLSGKDASLFADNKGLCGKPLNVECPESSKKKKNELSGIHIVIIAILATSIVLLVVGGAFVLLRRRGRGEKHRMGAPKMAESFRVDKVEQGGFDDGGGEARKRLSSAAGKEDGEQGRLVFVGGEGKRRERFELQDLLRASAEVLGGGEFGSSYKASLLSGPSFVVKRFKEMNIVGMEEFQKHMMRLGSLAHPNLLPLVAYYYRKEEKLLVTDFIPYGSLANLLHGNGGPNKPSLDWPARLKIVKGVARGLAYLYGELPMLSTPHGHLKSSNVLLGNSCEPLLTDYALGPVVDQAHASQVMVAYKSPECRQYGRLSKKTDVWSFGLLILEILTGKISGNYPRQGKAGPDLATWVNSVVREEWTGEVFDSRMRGTRSGEGEMLKLLQIGLGCCEANLEKRWGLKDAVEKIEELRERDGDEDYSSYVSEGEGYYSSSRAVTEDDFSFSKTN